MAFEDYEEEDQNELDADRQRRFRTMLAGMRGVRPVLGRDRGTPDETQPTSQPANSFPGDALLGRPRIPEARINPVTPPTFASPSPTPNILGASPVRPARPDVPPTRADFPAQPEVSGFRKYLGLGLSALAGLNDPRAVRPLAENILQ